MGRRHAGALPAMRLHKQSGQARIRINGREHRLGPFGSAEAQVRYDQLPAAYLASGRTSVEAAAHATGKAAPRPDPDPADLTIGDLCVRWIKTIQDDRDDWKSSSKYQGALAAARALRPVAKMAARDFGPRQLIEVRATLARTPVVQRFRDGTTGAPRPRSRSYVNETVGRIVQMFRWAVPLELVPPDKAAGLREIPPLKPGELSAVAESTERTAVDDQAVEAILSRLTGPMRASVVSLISKACSTAARSFPAFSIASASRSFATICSGLCFFRRLGVIESLLPRRGFDLHTASIRISNAGQDHHDPNPPRQSPAKADTLPAKAERPFPPPLLPLEM